MTRVRVSFFVIFIISQLFSCQTITLFTKSVLINKPDDERSVTLTDEHFRLYADGKTDDSGAIQAAIDYIEKYYDYGIVFIPSGEYAVHKTINLWRGIRLIGYGKTRPRFILNDNTPGFEEQVNYMLYFRGRKPLLGDIVADDNTSLVFFSGIKNIDFEIGPGNPSAVGIRSMAGQLTALEHINFKMHSGYAAVSQTGRYISECSFSGGNFAITTNGKSNGGPVLLRNCRFTGQNRASVHTSNAQLTFLGCSFSDAPYAVMVRNNSIESVFLQDCSCQDISVSTLLIDQYSNPANSVNIRDLQCANTPSVLLFRDRNTPISGNSQYYRINELTHGLLIDSFDNGVVEKSVRTRYRYQPIEDVSDVTYNIPEVPLKKKMFNIKEYGAQGDSYTDDTVAFLKAIDDHNIIYLPQGNYVISQPLYLRKNTCLIGLHPQSTQIVLRDHSSGYNGPDSLKPMVQTPPGGRNIISGIGFDAGGNSATVQLMWLSGEKSMLNDAWFQWGGLADDQLYLRFPYSILVDAGSGVFNNIWCSNMSAAASMRLQNCNRSGKLLQVCLENNRNLQVYHSSNWSIYALQLGETMASADAMLADISDSKSIVLNQVSLSRYYSADSEYPWGIRIRDNSRVTIRGLEKHIRGGAATYPSLFISDRNQSLPDNSFASINIK